MYYLCNSSLVLFCFISLLHHPHGASNQECNALQINQTSNALTLVQTDLVPGERELSLNNLESVLRRMKVKVEINKNMCQGGEFHGSWSASLSRADQGNLLDHLWRSATDDYDLFDSPIIRLARWDYIVNICPASRLNAPFNEWIPFSHYLHYKNQVLPPASLSSAPFNELVPDLPPDSNKIYPRLQYLSFPLRSFQNTQIADNLQKCLEVNQECLPCIDAGGACGYNQSSGRLDCYRKDEPHKPTFRSRNKGLSTGAHKPTFRSRNKGLSTGAKAGIGIAFGLVVILLVAGFFCLMRRLRKISDNPREKNLKALIPLKHYSYAQVKKITKSFAEVLGKGGFGVVYRGNLCDGRSVAVKILKDSKGNGEDFINEISSISKTSHVNIVSMLGFCSEGSKRAILYEFVENGSLDKFISRNNTMNMDRMSLYGIALGVARGIEYLHYGCKTRIVHFDIKPSNVLLDKNLCPKVSDFGLAKLCGEKESIMSLVEMRGTIGYIAPEMISRVYGSVSYKSDVYSYGMLVLEMIGARTKTSTEHSTSNASSMYFPEWIYKDLERGDNGRLIESGISSEEVEITKKMTLVGLWCIQSSPSDRPPMNRVVEMMEGSVDALEVPPSPALQMVPASFQESSMLSEDISVYLE